MQFVKEVPPLNEGLLNQITENILEDKRDFTPSLLYHPESEQKVKDTSIRSSEFRLFEDKRSFDLVQKYIELINSSDPDTDFVLQRNDLTHIRYGKGGFFKPHQDYLSFTSNIVEEYTMIICLRADCEGGETVLHINHFFKHTSKATTTTGHCLIFRKDLTHEGAEILSGTKEILTINLLAISKKAERTVVVTVPEMRTQNEDGEEDEVFPEKKFLIPLENIEMIPNNYILSKLRFTGELDSRAKLLDYLEEHSNSSEFEIVNKIFQKKFLTVSEIDKFREVLDYYQLDISNLMTRAVLSHSIKDDKSKSVSPEISGVEPEELITLYGDPNEYQYVLELVKKARLPLIPFTMVWMEGGANGEISPLEVGLITFSEYQNLLYLKKYHVYQGMADNSPHDIEFDLGTWISKYICEEDFPELDEDSGETPDKDSSETSDELDHYENIFLRIEREFKICFDPEASCGEGMANISVPNAEGYHDLEKGFNASLYLMMNDDVNKIFPQLMISKEDVHDDQIHSKFNTCHKTIPDSQYQGQYYNLDSEGKLGLEFRHLKPLQKKIVEVELVDKVKEMLPGVAIKTSQKDGYDAFMCNEQIYGQINLMAVYGFLKM